MLMTIDHWLARFFGAGRRPHSSRNTRATPLAQRAAFGHDGMTLRQIDGLHGFQNVEDDPAHPPYAPYLRRPRAVPSETLEDFGMQASPAPDFSPRAQADPGRQAFREALATRRSREILQNSGQSVEPPPQAPQFCAEKRPTTAEEPPSPHFWRVDRPNVRFTRTPESALTRRRAEEKARRLAEVEAQIAAQESERVAALARLAAIPSPDAEAARVRYARTPDPVRAARGEPETAAAPKNPAPPAFGGFGAMGARFSCEFRGLANAPARAPETLPVEIAAAEKPEKIRVRVKAGAGPAQEPQVLSPAASPAKKPVATREKIAPAPLRVEAYEPLEVEMLSEPPQIESPAQPDEQLEINSDVLEKTLEDFGVRGDILNAHPGPVVTLYEFEPAPGIKSSRVIGLADDIARSMSAISARVAVVPGRNAIGIELPNPRRETVYLRELVASPDFTGAKHKLAIALGKTIG
ncbi:DNA translocase FtsK, partial [uncultured Rhodoblastus sp.]|uniref:DNA translocase FtsK n=1 Tax=uncultured Rhodoblastus sp. TaxID=543037 RepID=UPI0025FAEF23